MKVLMVSHSKYVYDNRVRRVAEALFKRGDEVDVICLKSNLDNNENILNGVRMYEIKNREGNEKYVWDHFFEVISFFILSLFWVTALFIKKRYKLIHVHNIPDFQIFSAIIPKIFGTKLILDIHDIVPEMYAQKFNVNENHLIVIMLKWVEKLSMKFSDQVIVANDIWKQSLAKRSVKEEKLHVILNTPDDEYFSLREKSERDSDNFVLVYHGTLKEHFGVDVAIRAISFLSSQIPSVMFNIIGKGPLKNDLFELAKELNLSKYVHFYESLPLEEIPDFIAEADVGIVPKREGIFSGNALSTKLLELVKIGIPAVVSRCPVEQYYFAEDMVLFFEPNNPEDMAAAIIKLYKNQDKGQELVLKANEFNKNHNWNYYRNEYYKIVDSLFSNAP